MGNKHEVVLAFVIPTVTMQNHHLLWSDDFEGWKLTHASTSSKEDSHHAHGQQLWKKTDPSVRVCLEEWRLEMNDDPKEISDVEA